MTEISAYHPGTPCWVDLWTPDRPAAMDFYAAVFGWEYDVAPEEQHWYTTANVRGLSAAGIITPPGPPQPPAWLTYLLTEDVAALEASVKDLGGQSLTGVITIPGDDEAKMALLLDPTGAMVGIWQTKGNVGADVGNEPGAFVWNEVMTPDPATARAFYSTALGVQISEPFSPDFDYTTFRSDGRDVGGIGKAADGEPARWRTYFATADTDATVDLVRANGGAVLDGPSDSPFGRMAECADPQGAVFSVITTRG